MNVTTPLLLAQSSSSSEADPVLTAVYAAFWVITLAAMADALRWNKIAYKEVLGSENAKWAVIGTAVVLSFFMLGVVVAGWYLFYVRRELVKSSNGLPAKQILKSAPKPDPGPPPPSRVFVWMPPEQAAAELAARITSAGWLVTATSPNLVTGSKTVEQKANAF